MSDTVNEGKVETSTQVTTVPEESSFSDVNIASETNTKSVDKTKRKRITRLFPALTYEECLSLGSAIWEYASGQKIRRLTLFDHIGKSPESGNSRVLVTASNKYGIIDGSTQSEYLELTPVGYIATNPDASQYEKAKANFELAIKTNDPLFQLYDQYKEMKVPSQQVMMDFLCEKGLDAENQQRCVDLFLVNAKFIGLIKIMSGTERIISIEHFLEDLGGAGKIVETNSPVLPQHLEKALPITNDVSTPEPSTLDGEWDKICFYITPIGADGSEQRKHADLFMGSIVEPAVNNLGLKVIRSDTINTAGMITSQIIEHLVKAKLVIADLSFHNPNVFYELSLRHSLGKPVIHLIRNSDTIPFDIHSFRTIKIDDSSVYAFVPQIESYKAAVSAQARQLLEETDPVDNPITAFLNKTKTK